MKKAWVEVDVAALFVIILVLLFLTVALSWMQKSIVEITAVKEKTNDNLFLMNLLRTSVEGHTVQEVILSDYQQDKFDHIMETVNQTFYTAFGQSICFKLTMNGASIQLKKDCVKMTELAIGEMDGEITLPLNEGDILPVEIRLTNE